MTPQAEKTDRHVLELLRQYGGMGIPALMDHLRVTATAVRQRLDRLSAANLIAREEIRGPHRGRPSFRYELTDVGLKALDHNMVELANVLWDEVQKIADDETRLQLLGRVSARLADYYGRSPSGTDSRWEPSAPAAGSDVTAKLEGLAGVLRENKFPATVEPDPQTMLPILKINGCPYPDLSGQDHDICDVETAMLSQMLGQEMRLRHCRCDSPDGGCVFEVAAGGQFPLVAAE